MSINHKRIAVLAEGFADEVLRTVVAAYAGVDVDGRGGSRGASRRARVHRLATPQPADPDLVRLPLDLATVERRAIDAALRATRGNRVHAAALLKINRATLYNKLRVYGIR
jgi:DNA-binding NtrC family response regulator